MSRLDRWRTVKYLMYSTNTNTPSVVLESHMWAESFIVSQSQYSCTETSLNSEDYSLPLWLAQIVVEVIREPAWDRKVIYSIEPYDLLLKALVISSPHNFWCNPGKGVSLLSVHPLQNINRSIYNVNGYEYWYSTEINFYLT